RNMHEPPGDPNAGALGRVMTLVPVMFLSIVRLMFAGVTDYYRCDGDGWTLRTVDGTRAAHSEHTVAITARGPRILTAL
ncbi:type I methionyl aminopeptidase, partial [Streptomyces erythrochromogenes]